MTEKINIDPVWEEKYASGHQEKYPWDIVVSFVFRNRPRQKFVHDTHVGTSKNTDFSGSGNVISRVLAS